MRQGRWEKQTDRRSVLRFGAKAGGLGLLAPALGGMAREAGASAESVAASAQRSAPNLNFKSQSSVTLTLYGWYLPSTPVFEKISEAFSEEYPHITIDVVIPNQYIMDQLKIEFAAGRGPDVTCMNTPSGVPWIARGAFLPLQELLENDDEYAENLSELVPWAVDAYTQDGVLYGTPLTAETSAVYYNEELVREAGLPSFAEIEDDSDQWNWDTIREYAAAINQGTDDSPDRIYGVHSLGGLQTVWLPFVYSNGGEYLSPDGLTCNIAQEPAMEAFQYLYDLRYVDNVAAPPEPFIEGQGLDAAQAFQSGRLGIKPWGEWQIGVYNAFNNDEGLPFEWNIAQMPFSPRTNERSAVSHSVAVVVNRNTDHPEEAMEFVKFMARPEVQQLITSEGWGALSAHPGTYADWVNSPEAPGNRQAITASHEYARLYPNCPVLETAEVQDPVNAVLHQEVWYGERDLVEGLEYIEEETNDLIQRAL